MKVDFIFNGVFWGILLIFIGILSIINVLFKVNIPIFRLVVALFFIYLGIRILMNGSGCVKEGTVLFNDCRIEDLNPSEGYNIIFGRGVIDLSDISPAGKNAAVNVDIVFGAGVLKINPEIPTKIIVNSAFAGVRLPDGSVNSFGTYTYKTKSFKEDADYVNIHVDVVFGSLEVMDK